MRSARSERAFRWPEAWLLSVLLLITAFGIQPAQAVPCDFCCEWDLVDSYTQTKSLFCPDPCPESGMIAVCFVEITFEEFEITNCPEAICALLGPHQAICCGDEMCRFLITAIHWTEGFRCTCDECEEWLKEMELSGDLFTYCLGEDLLACEEADPNCCPD